MAAAGGGRSASVPSFFVGTPFAIKRDELRKSQVLDSEGRSRFHGAFEGGFSAGFYNTVGTAEGWRPSDYIRGRAQHAEDFMDEEDDKLLGDTLRTRNTFGERQTHTNGASAWFAAPESSLASIGKRLFALSLNKEARKVRFLNESATAEQKKSVPELNGRKGLGYMPRDSSSLSEATSHFRRSTKRSTGAAYGGDEDDDQPARNEDEYLEHVVEVDDRDDNANSRNRLDHVIERLTRTSSKSRDKRERWPDGIALPDGFVIARHHNPQKLVVEKLELSSRAPSSVSFLKDFANLRPKNSVAQVKPISGITDVVPLVKKEFVRTAPASLSDETPTTSFASSESQGFVRRMSSWTPSVLTKRLFGLESQIPPTTTPGTLTSTSANDDDNDLQVDTTGFAKEATMDELTMVFQPSNSKSELEFYSSEDSGADERQLDTTQPRTSARGESPASTGNDGNSRKNPVKKKHKSKRSKRRRKRRATSSSSSSSSTSSFLLELT